MSDDKDYDDWVSPPMEITETRRMLSEKRYQELIAAEQQLAAAKAENERYLNLLTRIADEDMNGETEERPSALSSATVAELLSVVNAKGASDDKR